MKEKFLQRENIFPNYGKVQLPARAEFPRDRFRLINSCGSESAEENSSPTPANIKRGRHRQHHGGPRFPGPPRIRFDLCADGQCREQLCLAVIAGVEMRPHRICHAQHCLGIKRSKSEGAVRRFLVDH